MFFEQNSLIITLTFSLCLIVFLSFYFFREFALNSRGKISFNNYKNKSLSFKFKTNKSLLFFQIIYIAIGIILSIIFSLNNVTKIYLIVYLPIILITTFLVLSNLKIKNTNKDLSFFDTLHQDVLKNKEEKTRLEKNLLEYKKLEEKLIEYCSRLLTRLNKELKITIPNTYFDKHINIVTKVIEDLKNTLDNYNDNQITDFDNLLSTYLQKNLINKYERQQLNFLSNSEFENLLAEVKNDINESIYYLVLDSIKGFAINNIHSLINIIDVVKEIGIPSNDLIPVALLYVSKQEDKEVFEKYLYENKLIDINLMLNVVNTNNYFWMYNKKTFTYFSEQDNNKILNSILVTNAIDCAYNCLMNIDSNIYSIIKKINDNTTVVNDVKDIFEMFISLYSVSSGYNNEANMYENMAFSLLEYFTYKKDSNRDKIYKIINYGEFLDNAEFIEINYKQTLEDISFIVTDFIKILLTYGKSKCRNSNLIDYNKLIILFQEYRSNLNVKGIEILSLFIKALVLIEEIDSSIINIICGTIKSDSKKYDLGIKNYSPSKHLENGRKIINFLNEKENENLIKILYRIEKERLSYDRIIKL